jgi:hypothetical protein
MSWVFAMLAVSAGFLPTGVVLVMILIVAWNFG